MAKFATADGFQNLLAGMGTGADNLNSQASYAFAYHTRSRVLLEAMYRGSWIVNKIVNIVPDDMTRAGIKIDWPGDPDAPSKIYRSLARLQLWNTINTGLRWGRLFGGAIGVHLIDGQDPSTPLQYDTIGRKRYRGMYIMDRWMVMASFEIVRDIGPSFGKPLSYLVAAGQNVPFSGQTIHHSRVIRFEGLELPYFQRLTEMGWGLSVIEPMYDRMIAFDTATQGIANLIHKAHLRTIKIKGLRNIIANGGDAMKGLVANIAMIRQMQTNEGITLLDTEDELDIHSFTFSGLSDVVLQFAQQLSGAGDVPMTRMFSQAPAGMNATGESDLRNYYDKISQDQESRLAIPLEGIVQCISYSELGIPFPDDGDITFNSLWQLSDSEKAGIASTDTATILTCKDAGLISDRQALQELQASAKITGRWGSISDEAVEQADEEVPDPSELVGGATLPGNGSGASGASVAPDSNTEQPT